MIKMNIYKNKQFRISQVYFDFFSEIEKFLKKPDTRINLESRKFIGMNLRALPKNFSRKN